MNGTRRPAASKLRGHSSPQIARSITATKAVGLGVLLVAWMALFAPQVFARRVFVLGDSAAFRPFAEFSRERWRAEHERTLWNPYVFTGIPSFASLADARPQYLPNACLDAYEWAATWLPPLAAPLLAHLVGMLSVAWLVRELWRAPTAVAVGAGIAWGLLPNLLIPFAFGHNAQVVTASLIPSVLLCLQVLCATAYPLVMTLAALALALVIALQLLAGHPQIVVYSTLLAGAFLVERVWNYRRPRRLLLAGAAAVLGLAMSAAVWWPALLYAAHSVRGSAGGGIAMKEVVNFSFAVRDVATLVWPWAVGFGGATYWGGMRQTDYPQYIGVTTVLLAVFSLSQPRDRDKALILLLILVGAIATLHALGSNLGVVQRLLHSLPVFSSFRVPVASLIITQLVCVMLAARGCGALLAGRPPKRMLHFALAALAVTILVALALGIGEGAYVSLIRKLRPGLGGPEAVTAARRGVLDLGWRAVLAGGVLLVATLARRKGRTARLMAAAIVVLIVVDLAPVSLPILRKSTGTLQELSGPPPSHLARYGASDPQSRVAALDRDLFYSNQWITWRARSVSGLHGAVSRAWDDLLRRQLLNRPSVLRALAVGYVGGRNMRLSDTTDFLPAQEPSPDVFRIRHALPRAHTVRHVVTLPSEDHVMAAMGSPQFDPSIVALISDSTTAGWYDGSEHARVQWLRDDPDELVLAVATQAPAFLVVADSYFPGWQAEVDGKSQSMHRVNHVQRGVVVPPGQHVVAMSYVPEGWREGVAVTRIAGATWLLLALATGAMAMGGRRSAIQVTRSTTHG